MYGTEGTRCAGSGTAADGGGRLDRPANRACPTCGQELWFVAANGWPEHRQEPADRPDRVVHRNDDADVLAARDASCTACARCDHEPDGPRCVDCCSEPAIAAWLPAEAAWACGNCTHPVVRPAIKLAVTGTW